MREFVVFFVVRVQYRRLKSSRSLSHLLMSFLSVVSRLVKVIKLMKSRMQLVISHVNVQVTADAHNKIANTRADEKWNRKKSVAAVYLLTLFERMLEAKDARMLEARKHGGFAAKQLRHYLPPPRLVQLLGYSLLEHEDSRLLPPSQQQSSRHVTIQYNISFYLFI